MSQQQNINTLIERGYECITGPSFIQCNNGKAQINLYETHTIRFSCHNFNVCPLSTKETAKKLLAYINLLGVMEGSYDKQSKPYYCSPGSAGDKVCVEPGSTVSVYQGSLRDEGVSFD